MVRVIMGAKGSGKTKQLIEMINRAASNENGSVVCVEMGKKLVYDVSPNVRRQLHLLQGLHQRHVRL